MRSTLAFLACGISLASAQQDCNSAFTIALSTATSPAAKCSAVDEFVTCLAGGATSSDQNIIKSVQAANGGCRAPDVKPSIETVDGILKLVVGADSDLVLERQGKDSLSFVGIAEDLKEDMAELVVSVDDTIADAAASTAASLAASATLIDQKSNAIDAKVDAKLSAVDAKLSAVDVKIADADKNTKADVKAMKADVAAAAAASDQKIGAFEKSSTAARVAALTALEEKLMKKINALESNARCSYSGALQSDGKTCKCNTGFSGSRCQVLTPSTCADVLTSGEYTFRNGKKGYCYTGQGGRWELIFNLATSKKPTLEYRSNFWTESKRNLNSMSLKNDCKGEAFYEKKGYSEVMIMAHNEGSVHGHAVYDVESSMRGKSFHQHFSGGTNKWLSSGNKKSGSGSVKQYLRHNPQRPQSLWGDLFIDKNERLKINKDGGWGSGRNRNRIATSLSNGNYGHTFAGMGGWHEHGVGSWQTYYEAAPISSYCSMKRSYGNDNNHLGGGAFGGGCRNSYQWAKVDYGVFVR